MKKLLSLMLSLLMIVGCLATLMAVPASAATALKSEEDASSLYVLCETDKDPLSYIGSDRVTFTFTVMDGERPVTVPELRYTFKGDDGSKTTGKVTANEEGKYVISETCMDMAGYMYLEVNAYGEDGKIWKSKLESKASHLFQGGILVNAFAIKTVNEEPEDFDQFWADSLALLDQYPADLVSLKELPDDGGSLKKYEVYINCYGLRDDTPNGDTFVAGYLTIPKEAKKGSLRIQVNFQGQGLGKIGAYGGKDRIMFNCLAHSVNLSDLATMADSGINRDTMMKEFLNLQDDDLSNWNSPMYGMSPTVNAVKETVYYRQMLLRDCQAINFLIKYFSDTSTATEFDKVDISSWAGLWDGKNIKVEGGSQGGFQAIGVAALHPAVTELSASIPWLCDIGAGTTKVPTGTRIPSGNRPIYAAGLDYVDSVFLAKRVTCKTTIKAGLGDPTCPPSGTMAMFNNLVNGKEIDAVMELTQGRTHGYTPTSAQVIRLEGQMIGISGWFVRDGILSVGGTGILDATLPEVAEWNAQMDQVKEIRINGGFTKIDEDVFKLQNKADVYIYCQLALDDRAFGGQDVNIFVPEGINIEGAVSLGKLSKDGSFLYTLRENTLVIKAAQVDALLDFSSPDSEFREYVKERVDSISSIDIVGEFAAIGKLKSIVEIITNCKSVRIDSKTQTLSSEQNFNGMSALETLGHWDFTNDTPVSYTEGVVDLTGFTKLLEVVDVDYILPEAMFGNCKSVKKIILPASLLCGETTVAGRFPKGFFKNCSSLEEIVIPEGVTLQSIEYDTLKGCKSLKTVRVEGVVSPSVNIVFEYATVKGFTDIPADCKFICSDKASAQKLADMFAGAELSISAVMEDGSAVTPSSPSDTVDNTPSDSPKAPIALIAAIAGGVLLVVAVIVIVVVAKKKKK